MVAGEQPVGERSEQKFFATRARGRRSHPESLRGHIAAASVSHFERMKSRLLLFVGFITVVSFLGAAEAETLAERTLKQLVQRQQAIFAQADKAGDNFDEPAFRSQL